LRYFKNFEWVYVIIDERLPVKTETTDEGKKLKLVFGGCEDP
jgi:SNF2 family DNA or RNA helicase